MIAAVPMLGVAVLSYQPGPELSQTLEAIATSGVDHRAVIVDNDSPGNPIASLPDTASLDLVRMPSNVGYGVAMNHAAAVLREYETDLILFLTQETRLAAGALPHLVSQIETDSAVGMLGPMLALSSKPDEVWSAGGRLTRLTGKPVHNWRGRAVASCPSGGGTVQWLDGACLLVRRAAFDAIGGFREDLFLYWEDVDLALRMARAGWRVHCDSDALAFQEASMTPPYLAARNRALVLGTRGRIGAVTAALTHGVADVIKGRGLRRTRLELRGLHDARRGALDHSVALERPPC